MEGKANSSLAKICVIGVYMGTMPECFPMWLKSAEANSTIDFLIVTDNELIGQKIGDFTIEELPANVREFILGLSEIKKIAEKNLGMEIYLERPYNFCDLKPVYGTIFKDYVTDYDFVGNTDFDLVYGDIRGFIEKYDIEKYDRFLSLGHLCLYRNTPEGLDIYKLDGGEVTYKEAFTVNEACFFDEWPMRDMCHKHNVKFFEDESVFVNVHPDLTFLQRLDYKNYKKQCWYWEDGHVYRAYIDNDSNASVDEFVYMHISRRKMPVKGNFKSFKRK